MIPRRFIEEWKEHALWPENAQIEQDLIIEKALNLLYSDNYISEHLAFRGGTAIHKLFLKPQVRYSEDVDLVQIKQETIKDTLDAVRTQLDFLGNPTIRQKANNNTLIFRFDSEFQPIINMRLKIEINCREHFTTFGYKQIEHKIINGWVKGTVKITTFGIEEMLATKLRALYQRKKGRDLFDIYWAIKNVHPEIDAILKSFKEYISLSGLKPPTQNQFLKNLEEKLKDFDFQGDIYSILRPGVQYDQNMAFDFLRPILFEKI